MPGAARAGKTVPARRGHGTPTGTSRPTGSATRCGTRPANQYGLGKVRIHDLRHAHASWLLAGGADLQVVKERLGHASISTTEKYLHSLPTADETALDALSRIRRSPLARTA